MIKKLPKSRVEFESVVPLSEWKNFLRLAAEEISQEIKIAGFRPGKAPRNLVEQKVGKATVFNNAAEKAVSKNYLEYIKKEKIEAIGNPEIKVLNAEEEKDFRYKAVVSVMPEIILDEGYVKSIKKINEEFAKKIVEVGKEEVDLELEKLAKSRVKLITVRREARKNDSVEIDFNVFMDGVPIENGQSQKHPLIIGKGVFIPGFEDKIVGMKEGEEKEFELDFPSDYHQKNLAGKEATFKVKMNLVQERQVPEINDEFARLLGDFENLDALEKSIRLGIKEEMEMKNKEKRRTDFLEKIMENVKTELPEILVSQETERMLEEFSHQIQAMGMDLENYLKKIKKDKEELKKDWQPQAKKRVISSLAIEKIACDQEIKIPAKEIEAEMNKTLSLYKNVKNIKKNIDMKKLYDYSQGVLENEAVFNYLEKL